MKEEIIIEIICLNWMIVKMLCFKSGNGWNNSERKKVELSLFIFEKKNTSPKVKKRTEEQTQRKRKGNVKDWINKIENKEPIEKIQ